MYPSTQFLDLIRYLPVEGQKEVLRALKDATRWHEGQLRDSGIPYIMHPIAVTEYLMSLGADTETLVAALLHDVVEDEHVSLDEIERDFGPVVAKLVAGVTKLSKLYYEGRRNERQVASLRKMLLMASEDLRVIFIKLADRWHNVETIESLREDKRKRVADETLDIYVPFARLLGLWVLKSRFEEICFPIAFPEQNDLWKKRLAGIRENVGKERLDFIERLNSLTKSDVEPSLQEMTAYEAFRKLQGNIDRLRNTRNIDTVLLLLKNPKASPIDCYQVLGQIHYHYPVWVGSFRDYISAPQANGYRALHTTIFLSQHHQVRLRIQTKEMFDYVTNRKISQWANQRDNDIYLALSSLHTTTFDKDIYMKDLKDVVLKERINVFTPSGEIISLPQNATGIDFAFSINPDHLSYLDSIRVNGELHEVTYILKDGDTVELVLLHTAKTEAKSIWLDKVKGVEAREHLKQSLSSSPQEKRREEGKTIIQLECRKRRLPYWWLFHLPRIQEQLATTLNRKTFDELLEDVGGGLITVSNVVDTYKSLLTTPPIWTIRFLEFFHLLPRSRLLDKNAKVMDIEVYAEDRQGLIHDITGCFSERKINIAKFGVFAIPPKDALYKIRLEVGDFETFSDLFDALIQVPSVRNILRKR